jgi:AcrR family transcriptional regulator
MAEPVKPTRRYHSPRRQEQAAATRRQILEAAERCFREQGYAATTMAGIAGAAGVALKTVYLAFETKSGVLRGLWNLRLRGEDDGVPMPRRDWYQAVLAEPDPEHQLAATAASSREVKERAGWLFEVLRSGASLDPDIAELWGRIQVEFRAVMLGIVQSLHAKGVLREEIDPERAADVVWTLNHPDVWLLLVGERGWTPAEWEAWFLASCRAQLLVR